MAERQVIGALPTEFCHMPNGSSGQTVIIRLSCRIDPDCKPTDVIANEERSTHPVGLSATPGLIQLAYHNNPQALILLSPAYIQDNSLLARFVFVLTHNTRKNNFAI